MISDLRYVISRARWRALTVLVTQWLLYPEACAGLFGTPQVHMPDWLANGVAIVGLIALLSLIPVWVRALTRDEF